MILGDVRILECTDMPEALCQHVTETGCRFDCYLLVQNRYHCVHILLPSGCALIIAQIDEQGYLWGLPPIPANMPMYRKIGKIIHSTVHDNL